MMDEMNFINEAIRFLHGCGAIHFNSCPKGCKYYSQRFNSPAENVPDCCEQYANELVEALKDEKERVNSKNDGKHTEMTLNEYQRLAARTMNKDLPEDETKAHALHGLVSEVGEIHGLYQKALQGHTVFMGDLIKEIGDCLWMIAELCTAYDLHLENVAAKNIDKLRKRYPDGFSAERSINREE